MPSANGQSDAEMSEGIAEQVKTRGLRTQRQSDDHAAGPAEIGKVKGKKT